MSGSVIALICVLTALATALGWTAARLTQDTPQDPVIKGKTSGQAPQDTAPTDAETAGAVTAQNTSQPAPRRHKAAPFMEELCKDLGTDRASLAYQPKLDVRSQEFHAVEALFRWTPETRRDVTTEDIILAAEQSGHIRQITLWTLKQALSDQLTFLDHGIEVTIFLNLSGALISDSEFALEAIEIIKSAPGKIGIEITETSVIEHAGRALSNLELYHLAGAQIAIDDYGTGLSSLRYLKRIPAQELKIDREFIKDLTTSHRDPMIVRSTIDLAHALGLTVTAEGVDDATQMALLKVMGCDQLQGFFIAKPMPLADLLDFMNDTVRQNSIINPKLSLLPKRAAAQPS